MNADDSRLPELRQLADLLTPHALRAVVTLGIPELVAEGVSSSAELSRRTGTDERVLSAVLAHLAGKDVFSTTADEQYALTDLGALLLEDQPRAQLHLDLAVAPRTAAFAGLMHTLTTGEPGYGVVFPGREYWQDLAANPRAGAQFDTDLQRWAETWLPGLLQERDFSGNQHVVDIGGGIGVLATGVLQEHPDTTATLVELPDVAERARARAVDRGVADRLRTAEQSFFDPLPEGGDVYVLAQVLHDWPDEQAVRILSRAADAVRDSGRVLVVERLLDDIGQLQQGLALHLQMLVTFGGGERGESAYTGLAATAGLQHITTTRLGNHLWVLEFEAAPPETTPVR